MRLKPFGGSRLVDTWMHSEHQMKIERHAFHRFLFHVQRDKILVVHLRSNICDLNIMIHIYAFLQSR